MIDITVIKIYLFIHKISWRADDVILNLNTIFS